MTSCGNPLRRGGFDEIAVFRLAMVEGWVHALKLRSNVVGDRRRLFANIGDRNDFPKAALGQRPQRPDAFPGARIFVDVEADAELIRRGRCR